MAKGVTCNDHVPQGERLSTAGVKRTVETFFFGVSSLSDRDIEVILSRKEPAPCGFFHLLLHSATCVTGAERISPRRK